MEIISQTAVWYHTGKPPVPIRWVLVRDPQGDFTPQARCAPAWAAAPAQIMEWFVLRWQLEVTFHETRAHLGVETQRQWSDRAIARTTPILMGLFSWVTLAAHLLQQQHPIIHRTAAWYAKPDPTFADAISLMRRHLWIAPGVLHCRRATATAKKPQPHYTTASSIHLPTRLKCTKSSLGGVWSKRKRKSRGSSGSARRGPSIRNVYEMRKSGSL